MRKMIVLAIAIGAAFPAVTAAQQRVPPLGTPVDTVRARRPQPPQRALPPARGRVVRPAPVARRPVGPVRVPQGARAPQARLQVPQGAGVPQAARAAQVRSQAQREMRLNAVRGAQVAGRAQVGQRVQGVQRLQAARRVQGAQGVQPQQRGREQAMMVDRLSTMRERLNLTDDQVKRMREIEDNARKESTEATAKQRAEMQREMERTREHRQKMVEEMRKEQETTHKRLLEVLTAEQRRLLEQGRANGVRPDRAQR